MQPVLATILYVWAAIYAYVGVFYIVLHARRRTHREQLAFGMTCMALALWSVGGALRAAAPTLEEAAEVARLRAIAGPAIAPFYCEFAACLTGRSVGRWLNVSYAVSAVSVALSALGLLEAPVYGPPVWALPFDLGRVDVSLQPIGVVAAVIGILQVAWGVSMLASGARKAHDLRPIVVVGAIAVVAAVYEIVLRLAHIRSVYLVEHMGILLVLAVSWVLLKRFVRTADELGRRTDELRKSYSELRIMQDELVRKEQLAAVGELSAVIAHEVRNPLAIIKNAVSSLRRPTLRASDRGVLLGILDEEVDRLSRLVRDLLAYARPVEPRGRAFALADIVREAVEKARSDHEVPSSIELALELSDCPTIHGDPDLLRQAVENIADNAMQAMPSGGRLTVRTTPKRLEGLPAVAIDFIDTGEGMDTLVRDKALDPFFTTRAAGTGLGLAIVERVVRNHGGLLTMESEPGRGTTAHLVLPLERPSSVPPPPEAA
jgi:signal transduction histidine kinase